MTLIIYEYRNNFRVHLRFYLRVDAHAHLFDMNTDMVRRRRDVFCQYPAAKGTCEKDYDDSNNFLYEFYKFLSEKRCV